MKFSELEFEKIAYYDAYNERADRYGIVSEWVARNRWGNAVAFGRTKSECVKDARRYLAVESQQG